MAAQTPVEIVRHASNWSITWGILLVVLGAVAICAPLLAAVAISLVLAWLVMLAGAAHVVLAFHAHRPGGFIWKLLVGLAYLVLGLYLMVHPLLGIASLTLVLAVLFLVEGALDIVVFLKMRSVGGASWILMDGIITLLLGLLIYLHWPSSSVWAIGTLVGVSMVVSGVATVMVSLAVRRVSAQLT